MKLNTKTIIVIAVVLFALLWGGHFLFRRPAPPPQATNPYGAFGTPNAGMPDMSKMVGEQAVAYNLITKYGLDMRLAMFISQTKVKLISNDNTSVHYMLTFPNGATSDDTITLTPNQKYTPTAADLQRSSKSGIRIYSPTLTRKKTGPQEVVFTLHYYALQSSLPPEFQQLFQKNSSNVRPSGWNFLDFVPSAYAQEGGNNGSDYVTNESLEFTKTEIVKGLEIAELEKMAKFTDNLLTIKDLVSGYKEMSEWLGEVAELEDCAKNPTNPLTQKAAQTSEYQQQVVNNLSDTSLDVQMAAFPKVANIAAGTLTQFMEGAFGAGLLVAPISTANDEAISEIVQDEIADARKGVTPCHHEQLRPGQFRPMQANFKYEYNRTDPNKCDQAQNCGEGEEHRDAEGTVHLALDQLGLLAGKGPVNIKIQKKTHATNQYGAVSDGHETSEGPGELEMKVGGADPLNGVVQTAFHSDTLKVEGESKTAKLPAVHWHSETGGIAADCDFYNVDLVHGGTYTAFEGGNDHNGTCKLEIFPE